MKKSKEIVGLSVISISEGLEIGQVKGLLVNPKEKNIEFLLLDEKGFSSELKGIPFLSAEAIGEFAVIVDTKSGIIDIMKVGILRDAFNLDVDIIGIKVITTKGRYLGDVTEYSVDAGEGAIQSFFYQSKEDNTEYSIPAANVITVGKEALIVEDKEKGSKVEPSKEEAPKSPAEKTEVKEEVSPSFSAPVAEEKSQETTEPKAAAEPEPKVEEEIQEKSPEEVKETPKKPAPRVNDVISEYKKTDQLKDEQVKPEESAVPAETPSMSEKAPEKPAETPSAPPSTPKEVKAAPAAQQAAQEKPKSGDKGTVNKLVEQQKQYVLGKTLIRDIKDDNGEVIAKENETVTDEIFMNLYKAGPNKVVEAMTYVKD